MGTLPTSSSRLSWLTQPTRPSRSTQESTGSFLKNTTNASLEVSPLLARSTEVLDKRVTELMVSDHPREESGNLETARSGEEAELPVPFHNKPNTLFVNSRGKIEISPHVKYKIFLLNYLPIHFAIDLE